MASSKSSSSSHLKKLLCHAARPIQLGNPRDYEQLINCIGDAKVVLIGEATHGTHEFYSERALITKLLIEQKGFNVVALEADFPDAYKVNKYVQGTPDKNIHNAVESLSEFQRFPLWMWRNAEVVEFIEWLRIHNQSLVASQEQRASQVPQPQVVGTSSSKKQSLAADRAAELSTGAEPGAVEPSPSGEPSLEEADLGESLPQPPLVGMYGLDLYSFHRSAHAVIDYLKAVDNTAAQKAKQMYACFDRFGEETMNYSMAVRFGMASSCHDHTIEVLKDLLAKSNDYLSRNGILAQDKFFFAHVNAHIVVNAEEYYRNMVTREEQTWNLRDKHMLETMELIIQNIESKGAEAKVVVWAHNSHVGDARATDMGERRGEWNIGQLCRERFGMDKTFNIGFSTHNGYVAAADDWDEEVRYHRLNPSRHDSWEGVMHSVGVPNFYVPLFRIVSGRREPIAQHHDLISQLSTTRLERAVGVVYKPKTEIFSHYFGASIGQQFDAIIHIDRTTPVHPLDTAPHGEHPDENVPETYPTGI